MLLGEWLDMWLELYVDPADLAENTKKMYHRAVRAVPGDLRGLEMEALTALPLRPWLLAVAEDHPRAAQLDRVMLSVSLALAADLGLCRRDLINNRTCPKIVHKARKASILSPVQLRAYMAAACADGSPAALALMLCACGLRRGEARGVTWADVDLMTGIVDVNGQRQGRKEKVPCKSESSARRIKLPSIALAALRRARSSPWGFICPQSETAMRTKHRAILEGLGLSGACSIHGLRHSVATACVMDGEAIKSVQGLLGHARYQLTADLYADHLPPVSPLCERLFA